MYAVRRDRERCNSIPQAASGGLSAAGVLALEVVESVGSGLPCAIDGLSLSATALEGFAELDRLGYLEVRVEGSALTLRRGTLVDDLPYV